MSLKLHVRTSYFVHPLVPWPDLEASTASLLAVCNDCIVEKPRSHTAVPCCSTCTSIWVKSNGLAAVTYLGLNDSYRLHAEGLTPIAHARILWRAYLIFVSVYVKQHGRHTWYPAC